MVPRHPGAHGFTLIELVHQRGHCGATATAAVRWPKLVAQRSKETDLRASFAVEIRNALRVQIAGDRGGWNSIGR